MDFYHPETKQLITDKSPENIYNTYLKYCTCKKNAGKYSVLNKVDNLGKDINFASYSSCPLNAISAVIMR